MRKGGEYITEMQGKFVTFSTQISDFLNNQNNYIGYFQRMQRNY